jgi:uncharacterized protein involved in exopolysaccharide biosynthesis
MASSEPVNTPYPPAQALGTDELSLGDFVRPLWKARYVVLMMTIAGGVLASAFGASLFPRYQATAIIRVIESKSGDSAELARAENFRPLLENKTLAAALVKEFALVGEPRYKWGGPGGPIPADAFIRNVLTVDQVAGTNLLQVHIKLGDADRAARVANALAERAIELNRRINQQEVVEARDYIKSQLDETTTRLEQARSQLVAVMQRSQVDALKKDAEGALDLRSKLLELQASIENERAFLRRSEADLGQSKQLLTTRRSIDREPALMEAAKLQAPGTSVLGLNMADEQINTAHSELQQQVSESRAKLAGLEGQRHLLVDEKHLDRDVLPVLTKLYEGDVAVSRLKAEYDMVLRVYTDLSVRYEDARIRVGGRGAQLQLVDPAVTPSVRASAGSLPTAALGAFGGALLATLWALGRHFLAPLL